MRPLLGIALFVSFVSPSWAADEVIVQQLRADGTRNTRPFVVKPHWEIRWETKEGLSVSVMRADADPRDPLAKLPIASGSQLKPGQGSTYIEPGGQYYLQIVSMGDWTVTVVQLP